MFKSPTQPRVRVTNQRGRDSILQTSKISHCQDAEIGDPFSPAMSGSLFNSSNDHVQSDQEPRDQLSYFGHPFIDHHVSVVLKHIPIG